MHSIPRQKGHLESIAITPDTKRFISAGGSEGTTIEVWDTTTGKCIENLDSEKSRIMCVAANHNANTIVAGHMDGTIWLRDDKIKRIKAHSGYIKSIAVEHSGQKIVSSGSDGFLRFWDTTTLALLHEVSTSNPVDKMIAYATYVVCQVEEASQAWTFTGQKCDTVQEKHSFDIDNSGEFMCIKYNGLSAYFPILLKDTQLVDDCVIGYNNNNLYVLQLKQNK
ncbi:WD40 repeat domain-containing protein [Candidatus Uabimicrobium sp. HlEnr_7]|uniref:WD40 repeat domain-containing protein n=1 Tax=Candidatus Uabimicrobium helgolandensis TaxID=3095367 RepID=UPI003556AEA0